MAQIVALPSRGLSVSFPDDATPAEIQEQLDKHYPRSGLDVAYDFGTFENFYKTDMTLDDYKLFREYNSENEKSASELVGEAASMLTGEMGAAFKEAWAGVKRGDIGDVAGSAFMGSMTGVFDIGDLVTRMLFERKEAPDTWNEYLFGAEGRRNDPATNKAFDKLMKHDFRDFKDQMDRQGAREAFIQRMPLPDVARGAAWVDPTIAIPVGFGTKPLVALAARGGRLAGKGIEVGGRGVAKFGEGVGRGVAAVTEKAATGFERAAGLNPAQAQALTRFGGIGAGAVTFPAVTAGVVAGPRIVGATGRVLEQAGIGLQQGVGRAGFFGGAMGRLTQGTLEHSLAFGLSLLDKPLAYGLHGVAGASIGAGFGGVLGGLAEGREGFWHGVGAGGVLGGTLGVGMRGITGAAGLVGRAKLHADLQNTANALRAAGDEAGALNFEKVISEWDAGNQAILNDARRMTKRHHWHYVDDAAAKAMTDGAGFDGLHTIDRGDGTTDVFINVDKLPFDKDGKPISSAAGEELFHSLVAEDVKKEFIAQLQTDLLGIEGYMSGMIHPWELRTYGEAYGGALKGQLKADFLARLDAALPKDAADNITVGDRVKLADVVEEWGAGYFREWLQGKPRDYLLDAGRLPLLTNAFDRAKQSFLTTRRDTLNEAGARFDFRSGDIRKGFYDEKGKRIRMPLLDKMMQDFVRAKRTGEVPKIDSTIHTKINLKKIGGEKAAILMEQQGSHMVERLPDGTARVRKVEEVKAIEKEQSDMFLEAVERDAPETGAMIREDAEGWQITMTPESVERIMNHPMIDEAFKQRLGQVMESIFGQGDIFKMSYWSATESRHANPSKRVYNSLGLSERKVRFYDLRVNKKGGIYTMSADWSILEKRMNKLWGRTDVKALFDSDRVLFNNEFGRYLENLTNVDPATNKPYHDSAQLFGVKQRDIFRDAVGPRATEFVQNPITFEAIGSKREALHAFKSFRIDRMSRLDQTGEAMPFTGETYGRVKMNLMPSADEAPAASMSIRDNLSGKAAPGTVLPAVTVISPELAKRFMPATIDPGYQTPEGKMAFPMLADRMKVGEFVSRSGRVHELRGGPDHPDIVDNKGVVAWAVDGGPIATQLQTAINKTDGIGLVVLQDEGAVSGNRTFGEIMIDELRYDARHRKKTAIDNRIKEVVRELKAKTKKDGKLKFPALQELSIKNLDDLAAAHPSMTFELRGEMFRKVASNTHGKTGGIFWRDVMREVTSYPNKDGYRTGDIVKVIQFDKGESIVDPKEVGTPVHPSYRFAVKGRSISNIKGRLSAFQVFRDAFKSMGREKAGRGVTSKGKIGAQAYRSMQMRSLTDPIFREDVGGQTLDVKAYDEPLQFKAESGPERAELARRSEINRELGAKFMPDIGGQDALGMFSAAERATVNIKQPAGEAHQMLAMIKKAGVKDEELQVLGLDKFLEGNRRVTKDEIIDHLVENSITVEEVVLGQPREVADALGEEAANVRYDLERATDPAEVERLTRLHEDLLERERNAFLPTKHDDPALVEPGAVEGSYRELLLKLPEEGTPDFLVLKDADGNVLRKAKLQRHNDAGLAALRHEALTSDLAYANPGSTAEIIKGSQSRDYTGGHYGEHPNVLAHVRFNERDSLRQRVDGVGRTFHIEEVQSDWHQAGRKKGYRMDADEVARLKSKVDAEQAKFDDIYERWHQAEPAEASRLRGERVEASGRVSRAIEALEAATGTVPDAPFKTSWHELAMKRMITYAVSKGYDALSWTKGETQFNRYGSQEIAWKRELADTNPAYKNPAGWRLLAERQVGEGDRPNYSRWTADTWRERGDFITTKHELWVAVDNLLAPEHGQYSKENFDKRVNKLTDSVWERMQTEDSGTSLPRKEGMQHFYDRMLTDRKFWKKLGLKVESADLRKPSEYTKADDALLTELGIDLPYAGDIPTHVKLPVHLVRLTPEVKAKVLDGGLARFMPDSAAPNTSRNALGWSLIESKAGKWHVYRPDGTLAGIGGSKRSAESIFRTHYKRELRKADRAGKTRYMPGDDVPDVKFSNTPEGVPTNPDKARAFRAEGLVPYKAGGHGEIWVRPDEAKFLELNGFGLTHLNTAAVNAYRRHNAGHSLKDWRADFVDELVGHLDTPKREAGRMAEDFIARLKIYKQESR